MQCHRPLSVRGPSSCAGLLVIDSSAFTSENISVCLCFAGAFVACTRIDCQLSLSAQKMSQHCVPCRVSDGKSRSSSLLLCAWHVPWLLPRRSLCHRWRASGASGVSVVSLVLVLGACWASWICGFIFSSIYSTVTSTPFLPALSLGLQVQTCRGS